MHLFSRIYLFTAIAALTGIFFSYPSSAQQEKPLTRAETEALIKKVITDNPELIMKSVENYQVQMHENASAHAAENITALQGDLKNNPNSPSIGNPDGDVTIVEFFDYHCGYCKRFFPEVANLLEIDKNLKIVFKEFPILSADSVLASKAALAVYHIDKTKYYAYHTILMGTQGRYTPEILAQKAKEIGIDPDEFSKSLENPNIMKELAHNKELGKTLNVEGTPAIVIGSELIPGAVDLETLKSKIAAARQKK